MSRETLIAERRDASGKSPVARRLRATGRVPGVLYRGGDSLPFDVDALELAAVLRHNATVVDLKVGDKSYASVVKDYQVHPVRGELQHIDLQEVRMDEKVRMTTTISLVGDAPGLKSGGVLSRGAHELHIEATPLNIPESIEVDISNLDVGASLHLSDLTPPEGVVFLDEPETNICAITMPRAAAAASADEGDEEGGEPGEAAEGGDEPQAADAG